MAQAVAIKRSTQSSYQASHQGKAVAGLDPPAAQATQQPPDMVIGAKSGMINALVCDVRRVGAATNQVARDYEGLFKRLRHVLTQSVMPLTSPAEAAETALLIADSFYQAAVKAFAVQTKTACQAQCNACCHLPVAVPGGVGKLIAQYMQDTMMPAQRVPLERKLRLRATYDETSQASESRKALDIGQPCPFLGDQGTCQIYAVRPPSCRAFTSTCAKACHAMVFDTRDCDDSPAAEPTNQSIDQNAIIFRLYAEANAVLEQRAKRLGQKRGQEPLAAAVLRHL